MEGHEDTKKAQKEGRSIAVPINTVEEEKGGWSPPSLSHFIPRKETRYPLHRGLDGPRGLSDQNHIL